MRNLLLLVLFLLPINMAMASKIQSTYIDEDLEKYPELQERKPLVVEKDAKEKIKIEHKPIKTKTTEEVIKDFFRY